MLVNKVDIRPQRRLLIRPGAIGDFIVSLPALEHMRAPYTEVWTTETNLPLVRFASASQSIIASGLDRLGLLPAGDVMARLRSFESIVSWYGAKRPEFRELVAGLPFEFFSALPPGAGAAASQLQETAASQLQDAAASQPGRPQKAMVYPTGERHGLKPVLLAGRHAVDFYCSQVGAPLGRSPHIDVGQVERHDSVLLHPFASRADKRWPWFGQAKVRHARVLRGPEEELAGATYIPDLFELARFIAGARAYVGNDSGITHLAAAVGTPTIALFGPTDPAVWAPRGKLVRIIRGETMAAISPEAVIAALADFGIY